jgi:hypothetical protein
MADFETTTAETDADNTWVWGWGVADIDISPDLVDIGYDIESFIDYLMEFNNVCYFHNIGFDGRFILDWLLKNGYQHFDGDDRVTSPGTFKTLISDMGRFYSITVRWMNGQTTEFRDSLNKIPMTVKRVAKTWELEEGKGEIDYDKVRPKGYRMTAQERDYLRRDVAIMATAMQQVLESGMTKLTVASDSLNEYKTLLGKQQFEKLFPILGDALDAEIRRAYRGGFTYADDRFSKELQGAGLVLDVNSLYPSVMMHNIMPWGHPVFQDGKIEPSERHPLTIFSVTFTAVIKPDHIPCIQIKGNSRFQGTEYLKVIDEPTTLMVTNVDWDLYNDHYNITVLSYNGGWGFHATRGMFDSYINKWGKIKAESSGGRKEIAKLHLNSLYGKFATNPNVASKIPILKDGIVKLAMGKEDKRPPIYTAVGVFITSFARDLTIRAAQANYDVFAYADTDSLHLLTTELPDALEVHPSKLGAWKLEYYFDSAFYVRAKAYVEHLTKPGCKDNDGHHTDWCLMGCTIDHKAHVEACYYHNAFAGLPLPISSKLTFDDLHNGKIIEGKLRPKAVSGGIILEPTTFELKI